MRKTFDIDRYEGPTSELAIRREAQILRDEMIAAMARGLASRIKTAFAGIFAHRPEPHAHAG